VLQILNKLANEPSKNAKIALLEKVKSSPDSNLFKMVCIAAFHPTTEYYIKKFDMPTTYSGTGSLESALRDIKAVLSTRNLTGHAARNWLFTLLSSLTKDDAEVLRRVLLRDLRCGMSESTVNKVWDDLIYSHPYMRWVTIVLRSLINEYATQ